MPDSPLAVAVAAAHAAGDLLLRFFAGDLSDSVEITTKSSALDLVTTADRAAEAEVLGRLRAAFPEHAILAEESGFSGRGDAGVLPPPGRLQWVVDPLDGTTNFAHGHPHFSVSIALCDEHGPRVGVVHDPGRGETFFATRGGGAFLLKTKSSDAPRRLAVTGCAGLGASLLATGFAYARATGGPDNLPELCRLVPKIRCLRRAGSAALDLAYVAAGRLDGYWEYALQPWDVAAGALLVAEAGGLVRALHGDPWRLGCGDVVAAGPALLPLLVDELRAVLTSPPGQVL